MRDFLFSIYRCLYRYLKRPRLLKKESRFGLRLKTISCVLVCVFFLQQIAHAAPGVIKPLNLGFLQKPTISLDLPESIAMVEDFYNGKKDQKTIILLQDAHTNESGQINVSKTLDRILEKEKGIQYIFLEAGQGDESLTFLRRLVPLDERKRVGMSFLRRGKLQGSEYLNLTQDHDITLWGVEDMELYKKAWKSYKAITQKRNSFNAYLQKIESTIRTLKPKIFSPPLLKFDQKHEDFLSERISLTQYFKLLTQEAKRLKVSLKSYPNLKILKKLKQLESEVDFEKANEEQILAIESLSEVDKVELREASRKESSPFKLSAIKNQEKTGFFALLESVIARGSKGSSKQSKLDPRKQYPELFKYFQYLKEAKKIDAMAFLEEQGALETAVYRAFTGTEDEKRLHLVSENLKAIRKLFHLTLTPDEYHVYRLKKTTFDIKFITGFLNKKIMDQKKYYEHALFLEEGYEDLIGHCETFYNLTTQRDRAFLQNTLQKMDEEDQTKAILITGGYHTPNLKYLLKQKNISFVSVTPPSLP